MQSDDLMADLAVIGDLRRTGKLSSVRPGPATAGETSFEGTDAPRRHRTQVKCSVGGQDTHPHSIQKT